MDITEEVTGFKPGEYDISPGNRMDITEEVTSTLRANVELVTHEPDPVAEAKRAADHKEYVDRRMKYICAMGLVNTMYQQERISLREYRDLEDCFARFYRFTDGSLERWRKPPEDSVFVDLHGAKPSKRTYVMALPALIVCFIFAGGLLLLIPVGLLGLAFALLST